MALHSVKKHTKEGGHKKALKIVGVVLLLLVIVMGVKMFMHGGEYRDYMKDGMERESGMDSAMGMPMMESEKATFSRSISAGSVGIIPSPPMPPQFIGEVAEDRQVIKNGSLSLVVRNTELAMQNVKEVVQRFSGFVDNVYIRETNDNKKTGSITVRVPAEDFERAMSDIKTLAFKVESENVSGRDVTAQVVDLDIRLKNMKAEEEQYREILKDAESIEDILNVTQRINSVRQRIESSQGQRDYLSRQVSMSTINISMVSEADVKIFGVVWSPILVIKEAMRDGLQKVVNFVDEAIFFLFGLPALLLWLGFVLVVLWIAWRLIAGMIRKVTKGKKK